MKHVLFSKNDILEILSNYNLEEYVNHKPIQAMWGNIQSSNYKVTTSKGNFVLKIEDMKLKDILFQNKVMNYLFEHNMPVQKVYETKKGKTYFLYENNYITIKDYLIGDTPKYFSLKLTQDIAKNLGLMQNVLIKSGLKKKKQIDNIFSKKDYIKDVKDKKIIAIYNKLSKDIKSIDYKKLRKCLNHGDLSEVNLLYNDNKFVGFIDFEEAGTNYLIDDISTFMARCLIDKAELLKAFKVFFREYQKYITLNDEEKIAMYYFIKIELIKRKFLLSACKEFEKISLKDFLKMF